MPHIKLETLELAVNHVNELLASSIPQSAKKTLCCLIESLLLPTEHYGGFNQLYWIRKGSEEWNRRYGGPENKHIIGPEGDKNLNNDDFVSDVEGEYARHYYMKK